MSKRRAGRLAVILAVLTAAFIAAAASGAPSTVTAAKLKSGFKKATGQKLVVDRTFSSPGHYTAFNLGVETKTKQARWGTFTLYLVTGADVQEELRGLLLNPHTGELEKPVGGIYWERDTSMHGDTLWMAKRLFAPNVVLWWTTASGQKKTDRTYATLSKALKGITR